MKSFFGRLTFVSDKRLEEVVAETVWPYGKMVALGAACDVLPQLGAVRVETDPVSSWQLAIQSLISRASHVMIAVGISGGQHAFPSLFFDFIDLISFASKTCLSTSAVWTNLVLRLTISSGDHKPQGLSPEVRDCGCLTRAVGN